MKKNGGPAFPVSAFSYAAGAGGSLMPQPGMTLRQWFAGQALANPSLCNLNPAPGCGVRGGDGQKWQPIEQAYDYADMMIEMGNRDA